MNLKILLCVTAAVLVAYLALFQIIDHWKEMQAPPRPVPEDPSFRTKIIHYQDERGNEVGRESRYQVRIQPADPEILKKLPPSPWETKPQPKPQPGAEPSTVGR
jgi:hypothetical protein